MEETLEGVVIVRAKQGPIIDETQFPEDEVKTFPDEVTKVDEIVTTAPEIRDTDAKAQLMGHNSDEAATIMLPKKIVPEGSHDPHEDIPSFNEWTQKRLEEAEKKKTHPNASVQNSGTPTRGIGGMKVRSKNYASPDCGAKVVATNLEARSARSVLASTRDEYMLNTCTSRIWFVVELCEAIQAKKIELANFELFSSSPKDFSVYISDRFPTRDWSVVGQFTAKDVKDIQSFALQPHLFGKFIKVELHTYHGSEHFCPISLFRAYGTSEFEVLETETENQISREVNINVDDDEDSDEEEALDVEVSESSRNLFGSARDAVLSIVKKAAQVLGKSSELTDNNITIEQSIEDSIILGDSFVSCTTPRYTILCKNCTAQKFAKVFQLVSCRNRQLHQVLSMNLVYGTLKQTGFCQKYGVDCLGEETEEVGDTKGRFNVTKNFKSSFLTSIFKFEYIAALCNILALKEGKMVLNTSYEVPFNYSKNSSKENISHKNSEDHSSESVKTFESTSAIYTSSSSTGSSKSSREFQITKIKYDSSVPVLESSKNSIEEIVPTEVLMTVPMSPNSGQHTIIKVSEEPSVSPGTSIENTSQTTTSIPVTTSDNNEVSHDDVVSDVEPLEIRGTQTNIEKMERFDQEGKQGQPEILDQEVKLSSQDSLTFDTLLSDLKDLEGEAVQMQSGSAASASVTQSTVNIMPQKESALERNMSLSGQYLEELSRRYKKQVEEMQRSLERTLSVMSEETRKRDERELKRAEEIAMLKEEITTLSASVKNLLYDRNSWRGTFSIIGQYILLLCFQIFLIFLVLLYCRGTKKFERNAKQQLKKDTMRRKSAENFSSHTKKSKKRRPSEIASHITGTYRELMIDDRSHETKKERKKKRKKEAACSSSNVNVNNDGRMNTIVHYKPPPNIVVRNEEVASRSTSSIETSQVNNSQICRRALLASENTVNWFNNYGSEDSVQLTIPCNANFETESVESYELSSSYIEDLNESNSLAVNIFTESVNPHEQDAKLSTDVLNFNNSGVILKDTKLNATSFFIKTALSTRKKRKAHLYNSVNGEQSKNSDNIDDKSVGTGPTASMSLPKNVCTDCDTTINGVSVDQSDESRNSSVISMPKKKDRKTTGFRKMVRKFF
ncbi:Protein osteopotentia like protein [Dufourea novaeangliae]|uniref:Protein osteopotentia like protein n=1 Tax=Dufourea novaeangliae TaxID=178035 RepID=A0A154PT42_DUFNO|nr:Protein osteopotentia like protein [Dufourea novaeangliae]